MQAHALISYPPLPISPCIPANPNTTTTCPHSSSSTSMRGQSITTTAQPPPIHLQNHAREQRGIILEISLQQLSWLYCTSSFQTQQRPYPLLLHPSLLPTILSASGNLLVHFLHTGAYFCVIMPGTPGCLPDVSSKMFTE